MPHFRKDPLAALFWLSTVFAAIIFAHALLIGRTVTDTVADIWELIFLSPVMTGVFLLQARAAAVAQARAPQPRRSEDAERSARRVGRVGARFVIGMALVPVFIQAVWITGIVGIPQALALDPDLVARAVFLLLGGLIVYCGNVVPKTPPPKRAGADVVAHRLGTRLVGWVMVIHGTLVCLGALTLEVEAMGPAWLAAMGSMIAGSALAACAPRWLKLVKGRQS